MPYIKSRQRAVIKEHNLSPDNAGELNFLITSIVHEFIIQKGLKYQRINEAIGVLECAKLELYRMVAVPYEDIKIRENGLISELDKLTQISALINRDWKEEK